MIDQSYQAEIDKNLDDQQRRPVVTGTPAVPLFKNFSAGFGGFVAGPNQGAAAWADILKADSQVMTATSVNGAGGMFSTPSEAEQKQIDAARDKLMTQGLDMNSQTGRDLRATAKDFLPDPQSTGKAGQILGSLTTFASQAIPEAAAGPAGLATLGVTRGVQKADELREQGVDEATRTVAGTVSGAFDAATMLLPMTGSSRLVAAGKGAVGGAGASIAQTAAEKLILQQGGYDRLASTYDPFDPVSIALSAVVPAAFGALHAPAVHPQHAGASPELAAAQAAADAARNDTSRIPTLEAEMAKPETTSQSKAALAAEIERIRSVPVEPARLDPDVEAAARVTQAAEMLDRARLSPDDDFAGRDAHVQAVETASDQIARGDPVEVGTMFSDAPPVEGMTRLYSPEPIDAAPTKFSPDPVGARTFVDLPQDHPAARGEATVPPETVRQVLQAERPRLLAEAVAVMREQLHPQEGPLKPNTAAFHEARAEAEAAKAEPKGPRETSAPTAKPTPAPDGAAAHPGPEAAHLDATTTEILRANPDLMVHMEGMEAPMRAEDLLNSVREAAAQDSKEASLLEIAAQCAISL